MLESIFGGLTNGIASVLDNVVIGLLGLLSFDMEQVLSYMPIIETFYTIFQWVALGLIAGIATFQLGKFFFGNLSNSKDSPVQILVRSAIAGGLIYIGNYFLQMLFDLFSYPMAAMLEVEVATKLNFSALGGAAVIGAIGGLRGILLGLLIILLLAWNIMKILLEAVERWLMLCVLTYTSPLAYSTVASQATHAIFSKWFSMVLGQCILLLANIWSVKIILNIVAVVPSQDTIGEMCFCCIMVIAFTRIAQRMDTYLQQLGIGAATTGRSMLDTIAGVGGGLLSGLGGGSRRSGVASNVMGAWGKGMFDSVTSGNVIKGAALGGGLGALASKAGKNIRQGAHASGMSAGEYVRSKIGSAASGIYDRATDAMGAVSPQGAEAMRQAKDTLSAAVHGGDPARETAQSAGMTAMEKALREGRTPEEAKAAGMAAFDRALKDNAPLGEKTSDLFANTAKSMDAREAFEAELAPAIEKMQNGASRMYIDSNGVIHNGFGEVQPNAVSVTGANGASHAGTSTQSAQPGGSFDASRSPEANPQDPVVGSSLDEQPISNPTSNAGQTEEQASPTGNATSSENELDPNAEALRKAMQNMSGTSGESELSSSVPNLNPSNPYADAMAAPETRTMGAEPSDMGNAETSKAMPTDSQKEKSTPNDTVENTPPITAVPVKNPYADAMAGQETKPMGADSTAAGRAESQKTTPVDDKAAKANPNGAATNKPPITAVPVKDPYADAAANQGVKTMGADPSAASRAESQKATPVDDKAAKANPNGAATNKPPITAVSAKNPYADAMAGQKTKPMSADSAAVGLAEPQKVTPADDKAAKPNPNDTATNKPPVTAIPSQNPYEEDMTGQETKPMGADSSIEEQKVMPDNQDTKDNPNDATADKPPITAIPHENPYADAAAEQAANTMGADSLANDSAEPKPIMPSDADTAAEESASVTAIGQTDPADLVNPSAQTATAQAAAATAQAGSPTTKEPNSSANSSASPAEFNHSQAEPGKIPTANPSTGGGVMGAGVSEIGNGSVTKEVNASATSATATGTVSHTSSSTVSSTSSGVSSSENSTVASSGQTIGTASADSSAPINGTTRVETVNGKDAQQPTRSAAAPSPAAASAPSGSGFAIAAAAATATGTGAQSSSAMSSMGEGSVVKANVPTMRGPNAMVSRTIAASANTKAAEAGTGFTATVRNPDPAAFDEHGVVNPGYSAEVISPGSQLAVNTINERGAEVADDIISSEYIVDNQAVAAAAFKNSSFAEGLNYSDISESFAAMDESGTIPAAREAVPEQGIAAVPDHGSISNMTVGKGVAEFTYTAPAQQKAVETISYGETVQTFETVEAPVERVSVRTAEAFSALPVQEQVQYHANQTASGQVFYTKRVRTEADSFTVAPEHRMKDFSKSPAAGSHSAGSVPSSSFARPKQKPKGNPNGFKSGSKSGFQSGARSDGRQQQGNRPSAPSKKPNTGSAGGRKSNPKRKNK